MFCLCWNDYSFLGIKKAKKSSPGSATITSCCQSLTPCHQDIPDIKPLYTPVATYQIRWFKDFSGFWYEIIQRCKSGNLFYCINIGWVPRKTFEHLISDLVFKQHPQDLANVNACKDICDPYNDMIQLTWIRECLRMKNDHVNRICRR